jgi:hypothetical protein
MFNVFLPKFLEQKLDQGGSEGGVNDSLKDCELDSDDWITSSRQIADVLSVVDVLYTISGLPGSLVGAYLVETSFGRTLTLAYSTLATSLGTFIFVFVNGQTAVILSSMLVSFAATLMCESLLLFQLLRSVLTNFGRPQMPSSTL